MESSRAMEKLLDEKMKREASSSGGPLIEDDQDQLLPSTLISQLESPKPVKEEESRDLEEIAKEIKELKKQNKVTHVLLSVLIILTLTWQVSQYSMIAIMKDRVSHPIRSISGMLSGMFRGKIKKTPNSKDQNNTSGVHIQVPELLQEFGFDDDEE